MYKLYVLMLIICINVKVSLVIKKMKVLSK